MLVHSSDELYGSDRMVLQVVNSMPGELRENLVVLLPSVRSGPGGLSRELAAAGVEVRHRALPILRRKDLTQPRALLVLIMRTVALAWWIRNNRVGAVYSATSAASLALVAARLAGVRNTVAHVQEVWEGRERRPLASVATGARRVIATSEAVRDALPRSIRRRTKIVENGIPTAVRPTISRDGATGLRFVVASRWSPRKGLGTLLEAWEATGTPPGTLVIAGSAPELGDAVDVPSMVAQLSHPDSVELVGQVDSIFDLLDGADAAIVPSDKPEAFGLVVIEAFSRGRPAIVAAGGGLDSVVRHGVDGLKFAPRDSAGLALLLRSLDRSDLRELGAQGLRTYENRFSAQAFSHRMQRIWNELGEEIDGESRV
ncbi:glycosyltransferase family 4 protein [Nocardioides sp. zg-1230]|nr:glycosyltransferase family 4 protein [Nocardioides sp. zg-1230]